jgi:hypothetical protein
MTSIGWAIAVLGGLFVSLVVLYVSARLVAIAYYRTKEEHERRPP